MKKLFLILTMLCIGTIVFAQETKTISLKDGSTLKGQVLKLNNGTYTIKTANLGEIKIKQDNVQSIGEQAIPTVSSPEQGTTNSLKKMQIMGQAQQIQQQIMSNPDMLQNLNNLSNNEEIMSIVSDPEIMNLLMSFDMQKIEQNEKIKQLMNNPEIKGLINTVAPQVPTGK